MSEDTTARPRLDPKVLQERAPHDDVLVWWLSPADICAIGEARSYWPEYLRTEYESLQGRVGRGRLWVAKQFGDVRVEWPTPETPLSKTLNTCGGIVIHALGDGAMLHEMPGVITDLLLRRWCRSRPPRSE